MERAILLNSLTILQLGKVFPYFMELVGSVPNLKAPTTCVYPEPDQYIPCLTITLLQDQF